MRNPLRRFYGRKEKLDYMHRSPVQRKLVLHPKDWPWSSWAHYKKGETGPIRIDTLSQEESAASSAKAKVKVKNRTLERHKGAAPCITFAPEFHDSGTHRVSSPPA
jgi:hypothetical protein